MPLLDLAIHPLGDIFLLEVGIVVDHGLQPIVEHNGRRIKVAMGVPDPFRRPHRADKMWIPVLAGVYEHDIAHDEPKRPSIDVGGAPHAQEHVGELLVSPLVQTRTPEPQIRF
jgi:hypothetical protein